MSIPYGYYIAPNDHVAIDQEKANIVRMIYRIRSIITRNQRALSGPFPDSAQISTVSKIGQSCRHGRQR